ncbi:YIP1 family protein [Halosimplex rubrum]|uniref:YIP1 family protein n=1 Tax=Halosimplex rubrum TaxID=869889 RepID=A0A7D5P689_9EURY|nr:Yip1 family protein [Halosimplex rubrum]QLH79484.1 YIP1 family protein [Halosimplex rubrum]
MIRGLLSDPDDFFARQSADPSFAAPVAVVFVAGVAINLNTVLVLPALAESLSGRSETIARVVTLVGAAGGTLGIFGLWFIYAGTFHTISVYFDGDGRFRTLFLLTGWGFLPLVLQGVFGAAMFQYTLQHVTVPQDPAQFDSFVGGLNDRPPLLVSSATRLVFLAWQAVLWTFAVSHGRRLSVREALATVGPAVFVTLAVNVHSVAGAVLAG